MEDDFFKKVTSLNFQVRSFEELEKHHEALEVYGKILELTPENSEALHKKAIILNYLENSTQALSCINSAIKIDPTSGSKWYSRGLILRRQENVNNNEDTGCFFWSLLFGRRWEEKLEEEISLDFIVSNKQETIATMVYYRDKDSAEYRELLAALKSFFVNLKNNHGSYTNSGDVVMAYFDEKFG